MKTLTLTTTLIAALLIPAAAFAQGTDDDVTAQGTPKRGEDLDPQPQAPRPTIITEDGVQEQAGVGGSTAYGRAGVLELGGSLGVQANSKFSQVQANPSIGWFVADNFQVSFIPGMTYISAQGSDDLFAVDALVEPSFHLPFNDSVFGFIGVGAGVSYIEDNGAGLTVAPRIGSNIMIGRSGILTPSLEYSLSTTDSIETSNGTLLAVNNATAFNIGYTVMW